MSTKESLLAKVAKVLRIPLTHFTRSFRSFSASLTTTQPYQKKLIRTSYPPMESRPGLKTFKLDTGKHFRNSLTKVINAIAMSFYEWLFYHFLDSYWRIFTPELTQLVNTFKKYDYELR